MKQTPAFDAQAWLHSPLRRAGLIQWMLAASHAIDFIHGFHAPDFLLPGQITTLELQPMTVGRSLFLCDNFCGDDHESMSAVFVVEA